MDLNIGTHCAHHSCKQLDFLPFTCNGCGKKYCGEHRKAADHECSGTPIVNRIAPECPLCRQIVSVRPGENPDLVMTQHIDSGCPKDTSFDNVRYPCHYKGCHVKEIVPITCTYCRHNHCVSHRNPEKHDCARAPPENGPRQDAAQATSSTSILQGAWKVLQGRLESLRSSSSKSRTAIMTKNKATAIGNKKIAEKDRIYLEVLYPTNSGIQPKWMFFEGKSPAGRALDFIAAEGKIDNQNNVLNARKLVLVDIQTGEAIKAQTLLSSVTSNGGTIMLEYSDILEAPASSSSSPPSSQKAVAAR